MLIERITLDNYYEDYYVLYIHRCHQTWNHETGRGLVYIGGGGKKQTIPFPHSLVSVISDSASFAKAFR